MVGGHLLHAEGCRRSRLRLCRQPSLQHLTLHIRHLAADLSHLGLEANQDPGVWSWPSHCLRTTLSVLPRVRMSWKRKKEAIFHLIPSLNLSRRLYVHTKQTLRTVMWTSFCPLPEMFHICIFVMLNAFRSLDKMYYTILKSKLSIFEGQSYPTPIRPMWKK